MSTVNVLRLIFYEGWIVSLMTENRILYTEICLPSLQQFVL